MSLRTPGQAASGGGAVGFAADVRSRAPGTTTPASNMTMPAAHSGALVRTRSARSQVHKLTPGKTETRHLSEISVSHEHDGSEVSRIATELAQIKHVNSDVIQFINEVAEELQREEELLAAHLASQPISPEAPQSEPPHGLLERGESDPSMRPPAANGSHLLEREEEVLAAHLASQPMAPQSEPPHGLLERGESFPSMRPPATSPRTRTAADAAVGFRAGAMAKVVGGRWKANSPPGRRGS